MPTLTDYGKADWVDYTDYWREADAEWIQERTILRYADAAARSNAAQWPTPKPGQVTYNASALGAGLDRLEMYSQQHSKWVPLLMLDNITATQDTAAGVGLAHKNAGGKGMTLQPTQTVFDNPVDIMGGVLTVNTPLVPNAVGIKTGAKQVKLTTSATDLVSDSPITAPSLTTTGAITAASATITALTAPNITMTGTLTGGVLNGSSGTIGGVVLGSNLAKADSGGFVSQQGYFYGDGSSALMRQRNSSTGALGTSYIQTTSADININATNTYNYGYLRIMGGRGLPWHNSAGTHTAWISPCIYSGSDPGAANYPDGTIWIA